VRASGAKGEAARGRASSQKKATKLLVA